MARVDIVEVVDARVRLRKSGREFMACCPFHSEKTPSFTVSPQKQFYHCFGCGAHGSAIGFLMEYEHLSFSEAVQELADTVGLQVPRREEDSTIRQHTQLYEVLQQAALFYRRQLREYPQASRAVNYLKGRGLTGKIAAAYGIGFAPDGWDNLLRTLGQGEANYRVLVEAGLLIERGSSSGYDRFRDRIMFPIRDRRGHVVGFGGRVLGDTKPKYLNSPETTVFQKGRTLYGLYELRARARQLDQLIIVEGYMDVLALAQFGFPNVVATLGTSITGYHIGNLFRLVPKIVFCFDGDKAGRVAAWRALEAVLPEVHDAREVRFLLLEEGQDPDECVRAEGAEGFTRRLNTAKTLSEFFFEHLSESIDLGALDGRARLVELAKPLLAKMMPGMLRRLMIRHLAELVRAEPELLERELGRAGGARHSQKIVSEVFSRPLDPVDQATALLIQHPRLAALGQPMLNQPAVDDARLALLLDLLELLQVHPNLTIGALLERWRGSDQSTHLNRLAQWHLQIPEEGMEVEFAGLLALLEARVRERRLEQLLSKDRAHAHSLSHEEKQELNRLLVRDDRKPILPDQPRPKD